MATDDKVVIGLTHAEDDSESVLISYLLGVEALRAGKQALMWLTKDGVRVATEGFAATAAVPSLHPDKRAGKASVFLAADENDVLTGKHVKRLAGVVVHVHRRPKARRLVGLQELQGNFSL